MQRQKPESKGGNDEVAKAIESLLKKWHADLDRRIDPREEKC